ncbi:MAG: 4Fe-4S binding protein [Marinifilaceae bacterium]|jgi:ferredoxin|nr:4Fe-4S binding protein [Marinifilaceae bacterium]
MKIYAIYFSPGGTTKKTVLNIAQTLANKFTKGEVIEYDMLIMKNRKREYSFSKNDFVILGFMTLVQPFGPANEILQCLQGNNTPIVNIALFGNGMYGNTLKVMNTKVRKKGFINIASAAFIGAMSYNREVAKNRPDLKDILIQKEFANQIADKISNHNFKEVNKYKTDYPSNSVFHYLKTAIMQYMPLGKIKVTKALNSLKFNKHCVSCGKCEQNCPVEAIDLKNKISNNKICIGCLACVNNCEYNGINYTNKFMIKAAKDCEKSFSKRREPCLFL